MGSATDVTPHQLRRTWHHGAMTDTPHKERVAVVTGASRGLGAGMAKAFAERGIALGLCARHRPDAPDGIRSVIAEVDVRNADAVERFADRVSSELGPIDLWINNAGVLDPIGPLRDASTEQIADHIAVNVLGVMWASRAFARLVHERPDGGTLVNISSGASRTPYAGWAAYCASKAAVDQLSRVLALEGAVDGLRVYSVAPGVVDTDMQSAIRSTPAARFPAVERFHQLKADDAFNEPTWVADRIFDLAFETDASSWMHASADPVVLRIPDQTTR